VLEPLLSQHTAMVDVMDDAHAEVFDPDN